jgi:hypothetical protein
VLEWKKSEPLNIHFLLQCPLRASWGPLPSSVASSKLQIGLGVHLNKKGHEVIEMKDELSINSKAQCTDKN